MASARVFSHVDLARRIVTRHVPRPSRTLRVDAVDFLTDSLPVVSVFYGGAQIIFATDETEIVARWIAELVESGRGFAGALPVDEAPRRRHPVFDCCRWTGRAWEIAASEIKFDDEDEAMAQPTTAALPIRRRA